MSLRENIRRAMSRVCKTDYLGLLNHARGGSKRARMKRAANRILIPSAKKRFTKWAPGEDRLLASDLGQIAIAKKLGRTVFAVQRRRWLLRKKSMKEAA